jgi:hypothetical protein
MECPASSSNKSPEPNPEAIAWYVVQAEALRDEMRGRVQSLRSRGSQLAGFAAAVVALVGGNADRILNGVNGSAKGIVGIAMLVGTILLVVALGSAIFAAPFRRRPMSDRAEAIIRWAAVLFFAGLLAVGVALGIFVIEVTF